MQTELSIGTWFLILSLLLLILSLSVPIEHAGSSVGTFQGAATVAAWFLAYEAGRNRKE